MKQNIQIYTKMLLAMVICIMPLSMVYAQAKEKKAKQAVVELNFNVIDESQLPVVNAQVFTNEGSLVLFPDKNGKIALNVKEGSIVLIEAPGYEPYVINLRDMAPPSNVVLEKIPAFSGKQNELKLPGGIVTTKRLNVGAVSTINGEKLKSYPDPLLSNTLQGQGLGLVVEMNAGGMNNNPAGLNIRGLHRHGNNGIIAVVDGIERPIDALLPEEIESITLFKDASTKILYGGRAANGVLMINTKRGHANKKVIRASVDYGVGMPSRMPDFIDSYNYAKLYNEARVNDGLAPIYSESDIEGYKNSKGENDLRYPNVDYRDYFMRQSTNYTKITAEFSGGTNDIQYALIGGTLQSKGLEAIGERPQNNRYNVRGNLDVKVNDIITARMDVGAIVDFRSRGRLDHAQFISAINSHRPNEYPLLIDETIMPVDSLGFPGLGASFNKTDNLYGRMVYDGYVKDQYISGQSNFGLDFDLESIAEGLSAKAYITFDNYFFGSERLERTVATYAQRWEQTANGADSVVFVKMKQTNPSSNINLGGNQNFRNSGWNASINYSNQFGAHALTADAGYFYSKREMSGGEQDIQNLNSYLRTNYAFKNKYVAEFTLAYMGTNKFERGNRFSFFPAGGLAWIVSEESFMSNIESVDFLKIKASAGIIGYDAYTDNYLYKNVWFNNGSVSFGEANAASAGRVSFRQIGRLGLDWEKSREINLGLEAMFAKNRLMLEMNYFNEFRYNIIQKVNSLYPDYFGGLFPYSNWGEVKNHGVELELNWNDRAGDLFYTVGANMLWSESQIVKLDQDVQTFDNLSGIGKPVDAMFGYDALGLFGKDIDLANSPAQTFGQYGIGDIAYRDIVPDGVINEFDREMIGNSFPRTTMGIDLELKYKGWGLYALGTANIGVNSWMNNSYYWNSGEGKYTDITLDRYHPTNNPQGTYPALTTTDGSNNFRNSTFWLANTSFFRLKNVEVSYTFENRNSSAIARQIKLYARGSNLAVISKVKELDPEALNAGVTNYPVLMFLTGGISVSF